MAHKRKALTLPLHGTKEDRPPPRRTHPQPCPRAPRAPLGLAQLHDATGPSSCPGGAPAPLGGGGGGRADRRALRARGHQGRPESRSADGEGPGRKPPPEGGGGGEGGSALSLKMITSRQWGGELIPGRGTCRGKGPGGGRSRWWVPESPVDKFGT